MRVLKTFLSLMSVAVLAGGIAGCGTDVKKSVSCSSAADCLTTAGSLFEMDASVETLPMCCGGVCIVYSVGCESGQRFLNSTPQVGDCTPAAMCPAQVFPDMSMPSGDM
jgi:hypothetical protein